MSATLKCKCPECDRVVSECIDSSLQKDRTEYDAVRCNRCVKKGKKKHLDHGLAAPGAGMWPSKKKMALMTRRMFTS